MFLTMLAIPFIVAGIFIKPFAVEETRCVAMGLLSKQPVCFPAASSMPEIIRYGAMAVGFVFIYAGRRQVRRQRGEN